MTEPRTTALRHAVGRLPQALGAAARLLAHRPWYPVAALGALLCALGWYGISGERYPARQLPYLASASIPGAALLVAAAVLLARHRADAAGDQETRRRIAEIHALLLEAADDLRDPGATAAGRPEAPAPPVALPGSTLYHRPSCRLVRGKPGAAAVDPALDGRGLSPCPVCLPGPGEDPGTADAAPAAPATPPPSPVPPPTPVPPKGVDRCPAPTSPSTSPSPGWRPAAPPPSPASAWWSATAPRASSTWPRARSR
ncbi:hypothetical protein [Phaeacidiphilus oryzae]|uniref:hypothetical protein n=1 Tax=Phaeacidiphilus oryzae TaxID=348818 RepID=UPI002AFF362E|nr:hypothetical protein [Phaeacidiphilus oryzae]